MEGLRRWPHDELCGGIDACTPWDGDFNEITYIPPDTLVANMRHGEGPDCGGGRD
eukprot:SAG11_NODE_33709_length_275_cov_10.272727_1_plen_54_part_01